MRKKIVCSTYLKKGKGQNVENHFIKSLKKNIESKTSLLDQNVESIYYPDQNVESDKNGR